MQLERVIDRISYRLPTDDGRLLVGTGYLCDEAHVRAADVVRVAEVSGDPAAGRYALVEIQGEEPWLVRGDANEIWAELMAELKSGHRYAGPVGPVEVISP